MKKALVMFCIVAAIVSCSNNADSKTADANETTEQENPKVEKGLNLIAKSDCLTCHQVETQATGPAYKAVAERYENNPAVIDSLASKIIHGGSGNWGGVPMTPHPSLSKDDAEAMVTYILSLK